MGNSPLSSGAGADAERLHDRESETYERATVTSISSSWGQWREAARDAVTPAYRQQNVMYSSVSETHGEADAYADGDADTSGEDHDKDKDDPPNEMCSTTKMHVELHVARDVVGPVVVSSVQLPATPTAEWPPTPQPVLTVWIKGQNKNAISSTKLDIDSSSVRMIIKPLFPGVRVSGVEVHLLVSDPSLSLVLRCVTNVAVRNVQLQRLDATCASMDVTRSYVRALAVRGTREMTQTLSIHGLEAADVTCADMLNVDAHALALTGSGRFTNCGLAVLNFTNEVELDERSADTKVVGRQPKPKPKPKPRRVGHEAEAEAETEEDAPSTPTVLFTREGAQGHLPPKTSVIINVRR